MVDRNVMLAGAERSGRALAAEIANGMARLPRRYTVSQVERDLSVVPGFILDVMTRLLLGPDGIPDGDRRRIYEAALFDGCGITAGLDAIRDEILAAERRATDKVEVGLDPAAAKALTEALAERMKPRPPGTSEAGAIADLLVFVGRMAAFQLSKRDRMKLSEIFRRLPPELKPVGLDLSFG